MGIWHSHFDAGPAPKQTHSCLPLPILLTHPCPAIYIRHFCAWIGILAWSQVHPWYRLLWGEQTLANGEVLLCLRHSFLDYRLLFRNLNCSGVELGVNHAWMMEDKKLQTEAVVSQLLHHCGTMALKNNSPWDLCPRCLSVEEGCKHVRPLTFWEHMGARFLGSQSRHHWLGDLRQVISLLWLLFFSSIKWDNSIYLNGLL